MPLGPEGGYYAMGAWSMPAGMRIGPISLRVRALDEVTAFYRDVVGLHPLDRSTDRARLGSNDTVLIELIREDEREPRSREAAGLFHTALRVPNSPALGAALERAEAAGAVTGASDHGVSEALYLADPEDNGIEIYRDRPRDVWPHRDGQLIIPTDPLDLSALRSASDHANHVPEGTDVGHVHLEVSDLDRSRRFYRDRLGMNVRYEVSGACFLAAGEYHHHVGINTWQHRTAPCSGLGLDSIAFSLPAAERRAFVDTLDEAADDPGTVSLTDPDEIPVSIDSE